MKTLMGLLAGVLLFAVAPGRAVEAEWVAAMKAVHARGGWEKGSVSQIGDSITCTKAFLAGLAWEKPAGFPAVTARVNGKLLNERKGPSHANYSGWVAAQGLEKIQGVLAAERPELAVIMYGVNDVTKGVAPEAFEKQMAGIVDACLAAGCVPILTTISPVLGKAAKVEAVNDVVKKLAREKKVPLVDFHAAILARQPGETWNGTLLGKGDVHPSGGRNLDFSAENLKVCGYALRNYVTLQAMQEVIEKCF